MQELAGLCQEKKSERRRFRSRSSNLDSVAVKITSNSQIKEQKIAADREMKRKYYNAFIEAFTKKLFYIGKHDCIEKIEAEMTFVLEANRLPLYASEEMIQFIEKIKNPQIAKETKMEEFLIILRRDLCENTFENFSDIKGISLVLPNDAERV